MPFLRYAEIVALLALLLVAITQLALPAWRGQKLFPLLRRQGKLERKLADEVQRNEERKVTTKISRTTKQRKRSNVDHP